MMTDPISAMINSIKNASLVKKTNVVVPYSKMKHAIADKLSMLGFVGEVTKIEKNERPLLSVTLVYTNGEARVRGLQRVSKPGRRLYRGTGEIFSVREGMGAMILSTPEGILSDREARKKHVGGEALFTIW